MRKELEELRRLKAMTEEIDRKLEDFRDAFGALLIGEDNSATWEERGRSMGLSGRGAARTLYRRIVQNGVSYSTMRTHLETAIAYLEAHGEP